MWGSGAPAAPTATAPTSPSTGTGGDSTGEPRLDVLHLRRYVGGFRRGVVTGPGVVLEASGATRRVGQQETIQLRSTGGKYIELVRAMAQFLGLGEFLQKYVDFYYDTLVPGLAAYLPSALTG